MPLEKEKIQYIIVAVLLVIFALALMNPPKKAGVGKVQELGATQNFKEVLDLYAQTSKKFLTKESLEAVEKQFTVQASSRDPFLFLVDVKKSGFVALDSKQMTSKEEPAPEFTIEGILYNSADPRESVAIILGEEKRIGDLINGWTVVKISDDIVTFSKGKQKHEVYLYGKS